MVAHVEASVHVARPVAAVFAALLDFSNTARFDSDVRSVEQVTPGAIGVGTEFRFLERLPPFGRHGPASARYTAIEPNRRTALDVRLGPSKARAGFSFEAVGDGTLVTFKAELQPPLLLRPLSGRIAAGAQKTWERKLREFKAWMESDAGPC